MKKTMLLVGLVLALYTNQSFAADTVGVATKYVGAGEVGGDNRGAWVKRFGGIQGQPWCAAFVSECLIESGVIKEKRLRARELFHMLLTDYGWQIAGLPHRGDIVLFWRGSPKGELGHIGIVTKAVGADFWTIEGNVGSYPAKVREIKHSLGESKILAFARPPQ